jgi:hypothetical protein
MLISLNIRPGSLIFGDTVTQSRHFVQKFTQILKHRVLCQTYFTIIYKDDLYF